MSNYGLKIGSLVIDKIDDPIKALDLIKVVAEQFLGESWTSYQPKCPLCNGELCDHEKNMNRPVGECTSKECGTTIHPADYFGKVMDILTEFGYHKEKYEAKLQEHMTVKSHVGQNQSRSTEVNVIVPENTETETPGDASETEFLEQIDGKPVFVW
jgi:hypothetical protein